MITKKKIFEKNKTGNAADSILAQGEADTLSKSMNLGYTSPVTKEKAEALFDADTAFAVKAVNNLTLPAGCAFSQPQFDALVSLTFNCGAGVLKTGDVVTMLKNPHIFASGALTAAQADDCSKQVSNAFSYDKNLKPRRNAEAALFCKGRPYTHKYPVYSL